MDQQSPRGARQFAHIDAWVFDLDNTLYAARHNLFDLVDERIGAFIASELGVGTGDARRVQKDYFREFGTTLRGLMVNHAVDPQVFLEFVHDIDVSRVPPSPELDRVLGQLTGRKLVYTNGSTHHAENVMARLGVAHHFDGVFDIVEAEYLPKPHPEPYAAMVERHGVDPRTAVMVEDIARNLKPASDMGMTTVWVRNDSPWGREDSDGDHIDHVIDDLVDWLSEIVEDRPGD